MSEVKYRTITISSMLDCHINGQKRSTFISASVDLGGVSEEEFKIEQLKVGLQVAAAAIQNAVCRLEMSEDEARSRITEIKENYSGLIKKMEERAKKPDGSADPPF
jgi:hypothetical protein